MTRLNDQDLGTEGLNGATGGQPNNYCGLEPCFAMCYLREPLEIYHIIIYLPQSNWRYYRTTDMKVDMYASVEFALR